MLNVNESTYIEFVKQWEFQKMFFNQQEYDCTTFLVSWLFTQDDSHIVRYIVNGNTYMLHKYILQHNNITWVKKIVTDIYNWGGE